MIPNPIHKVLSTLRSCRVRFLLMGGQACVFYGAAEFSRDTDIVLLADAANLKRFSGALKKLRAECIAVPPLSVTCLLKGHAVHFRCHHPEAAGMRIDIMAVLRGLPSFETLWKRRTTVRMAASQWDLMSLPDLVQAKKTQRDKDWPMLRRLVEAHYTRNRASPTPRKVDFWLREARTPSMLMELARDHRDKLKRLLAERPLLALARDGREAALTAALAEEENRERLVDRTYWDPLKRELEQQRLALARKKRGASS